ncbi:MAG: AAA family ATPase [Chloroflexia bacterium]|nr:AAA family ATPase [Chloroflexia bacterium]
MVLGGKDRDSPDGRPAEVLVWEYRVPGAREEHREFYEQLYPYIEDALYWQIQDEGFERVGQRVYLDVGQYRVEVELVQVDPPLASQWGRNTRLQLVFAQAPAAQDQKTDFLAARIAYPNKELGQLYDSLVGIDEIKHGLLEKLILLLSRQDVQKWSREKFGTVIPACEALLNRYPFFVLEGDVGCGKTALARSIGHPLAIRLGRPLEMLILNTQVRGRGLVGELSNNITQAFQMAENQSLQFGHPVLLLIDEADALAQKRGGRQMHHEDDAGVNTLIQRIDLLQSPGKEVIVLFATNMGKVLDSAIKRRAAASFSFGRPDDQGRRLLFQRLLRGSDVGDDLLDQLVQETRPRVLPGYGTSAHPYTYSDIVQRLVPLAVEKAFFSQGSLQASLLEACRQTLPTPLLFEDQD